MLQCASCAGEVAEDSNYCSSCGEAVDPSLTPTRAVGDPRAAAAPRTSHVASLLRSALSDPAQPGRFATGDVVADRYKIVGLLGRGGMGEVYRADDLTLGQSVALKFLAPQLADKPGVRERFFNEVRVARQITHPNVCRVHDIGEYSGQLYLSMEYVDGEDLASLLRRIGHVPTAKGAEIARQLCAGLAAAHQQGLLHRDLKPANVMIDGRGRVRVTDFGLAGLADEVRGQEIRSGTPAYMAPEQLAGREVSVQSDLFSLGLVLYELFTGRSAFKAGTLEELRALHEHSEPVDPARHVDIDAAVGRAILHCLERDPADRPASAVAVAAALPGSDPLAAALAAGETPSPELVAAARVEGSLRPWVAAALLAAFVVQIVAVVMIGRQVQLIPQLALTKPRAVLADTAQTLLERLGHANPADAKSGFFIDPDLQQWLRDTEQLDDRWQMARNGQPPALRFWYRQGPRELDARVGPFANVTRSDPPPLTSGMAMVELDPLGRLVRYEAVPPQREEPPPAGPDRDGSAAPDWDGLFEAAGLDPADFASAAPAWVPPYHADSRAAWTGSLGQLPGIELRVEAAGYRGQPFYFHVIGPWTRAERETDAPTPAGAGVRQAVVVTIILVVLTIALWMARRNLRAGKGDRRGAFRLGLVMFLLYIGVWVFWSDHTGEIVTVWGSFVRAAGFGLFVSGLMWMLYVALEPYVRRSYPTQIVAWTRLLAGRVRDPLVGRDVLIGSALGAGVALVVMLTVAVPRLLGDPQAMPLPSWVDPLNGIGATVGRLMNFETDAVFSALFIVFVWFLLRRLLRIAWLANLALFALLASSILATPQPSAWSVGLSLVATALLVVMVVRFGLLCILVGTAVADVTLSFPMPADLSAWYAGGTWLALASLAAVVAYGFYTSLGGRSVLPGALLEE